MSEVIRRYALEPLSGEGGFFRFISRFGADAGCIFYLVTSNSFSSLHRLVDDELWFFLDGDDAIQLTFDEETGHGVSVPLDRDHRTSLVKGGLWQATKLVEGGRWALFSTVMSPHYDESMYSSPPARLLEDHPFLKEYLNA